MPPLYFDHNAHTPLREDLREVYLGWLAEGLGNPSSLHGAGRRARALIDEARERVAAALAVHEDELVFTSGGTEADNLALLGAARLRPGGVATSPLEHAAVLGTAAAIEAAGRPHVRLAHDAEGRIDLESLTAAAAREDIGVVSVAAANGELGTVEPLEAAVDAARRGGEVLFHTDAVQALGRIPLDLAGSGVDLAAGSAHKLGGPVGVGLLYIRRGCQLPAILHGGGQEAGLRPGTENAAAIATAALAIERAVAEREATAARLRGELIALERELRARIPQVRFNGPAAAAEPRLPNTLNVTLPNVDGRVLITRLDLAGLQVSSGSACASGSAEPSHVLMALGRTRDEARASVRLSLGRTTRGEDCREAVEILVRNCARAHASRVEPERL